MDWGLFAVLLIACGAAGSTGMLFPPGSFYDRLDKPSWTPPRWAFPVAWTSIYLLISFAGARVAGSADSGAPLAFWALQGALSTLWTPVFFGLRRLRGAIPIILLLWLAVAGCVWTHWQADLWAGLAFLPYLAWVTVASALNIEVARRNPEVEPLHLDRL